MRAVRREKTLKKLVPLLKKNTQAILKKKTRVFAQDRIAFQSEIFLKTDTRPTNLEITIKNEDDLIERADAVFEHRLILAPLTFHFNHPRPILENGLNAAVFSCVVIKGHRAHLAGDAAFVLRHKNKIIEFNPLLFQECAGPFLKGAPTLGRHDT
jgi:hypothetical protein